ncbi:hypothetical protein HQ489_04755 [Candidatus Woesearchaeota archaeon]|nr:hypothetical protein [Candidatus Woesearchaeota archaeon]
MGETLAYHAKAYQKAKDDLKNPVGFAILIDCHRNDYNFGDLRDIGPLPSDALPTSAQLEELGIERVVYLLEAPVGIMDPKGHVSQDLRNRFDSYKTTGFDFFKYGIDMRIKPGVDKGEGNPFLENSFDQGLQTFITHYGRII